MANISWGSSKFQKLKFDGICFTDEGPIDKGNSIWGEKSLKVDI
jgi:hypothetical protein